MTNYGHALRFGVEILADAATPQDAVDLAMLADQLGSDIVAFADRLDDGGVDALTMAGWAAARTTTAQVAATRLSPTDRPASVLARGSGSLQLLSAGRALLLLGPVDTAEPEALEDAVAVVRSLHDNSGPDRASHRGVHHRLDGAERGPVLDRAVPLWLMGGDDTTAALAGRVADGWLVDLDVIQGERLTELTTLLDRAATEAGRDVREIRRGVTLPAGGPVDVRSLVALVVDHGVSGLLLRVDGTAASAATVRDFLGDVARAVQQGVDQELEPGTLTTRPVRRSEVRGRRRADIAYDEVPEELAGTAVEPGDAAFARVRSTYLRGGSPGLVLRPHTVAEVASAVAFAREHRHLPLGIRSGGHGISGRSTNDGGLVIDLGALAEVTVLDHATRLVRIGPGARWRDVATVLQPHGWALSSGDYGGVGVGGLATAGGIGFLNRKHGLTIDHLRAVEMVLADGTVVRATATEHPELFWAVRGAGANFGIAVAFEFVVDQVTDVGWAQLAFQALDPATYLESFGQVMATLSRDTTPFLILGRGVAQLMAMVDSADPEVIINQLQPFAEIAPLVQQQVVIAPYAAVMTMFPDAPHNGRGEPVSRSALTHEITPAFAAASAELINSGVAPWYQIRTTGGAVADVPADATAYAHRDANFSLAVMGTNARLLDHWFDPVRRESDGLYLSFESDRSPERILDAFPPVTLGRLRRLKAQVDPDNLFQDNFNISPDSTNTPDSTGTPEDIRSAS